MRQNPNPRRSRGRGPHKPHMQTRSQGFDGGGSDTRVRGNAYQVLEKYLAMAREANTAGDRVAAENYLQHAEHYYRVISASGDQGARRQGGRPDGDGGDQSQGAKRPGDAAEAPPTPRPGGENGETG